MDNELITGVAHLGIRVYDLETSRAFYEKLGFEFKVGPVGPEPVAILVHPSGVEVNFVLNAAKATEQNILMDVPDKYAGYTHVALRVSDLDAMRALLDREGISVSGGPVDYPGGHRGLFIRDPDRNVIEFFEPAR